MDSPLTTREHFIHEQLLEDKKTRLTTDVI